ncbi:MAG: hypothetical protein MI866_24225 [Bacteroidales bacterium]|nr:hypothetical protein [Bacteroidales bacterium]
MKRMNDYMKGIIICMLLSSFLTKAQQPNMPKLNVYLDCTMCDMTYLRQEMNYLNFARDQKDADVYIMVLTQKTGSGGTEYDLEFSGQGKFDELFYRSSYIMDMNATADELREELKMHLEMGLGNFWSYMFQKVRPYIPGDSTQTTTEVIEPLEESDKWNSWVFSLGLSGSQSGEETSTITNINGSLSAKRVTEKNKFYLRGSWDKNTSEFTYEMPPTEPGGKPITLTNKYIKENRSLDVRNVFSIYRLWSLGAFAEAGNSVYGNTDLYLKFKPAIEFSVFPYEEATRKQITLSYRAGAVYNEYIESSIFNKNDELLWEQSVELGGSFKQKWGTISGSATYDSFLHDSELYALNFSVHANLRIFKGFSFNFMSSYNITHNQVHLPGGGLSIDELLLRQKQAQSGYNYYTSIGFSYTFGSMFNPVVNPRFGF